MYEMKSFVYWVSLMYLSEIFKALGDMTRLRILNLLSRQELCVCQINEVLKLTQPNASKHLNKLKFAGIITCRKVSQWCFYQVDQNFVDSNSLLYQYLSVKWSEVDQFKDDTEKLQLTINRYDCCKKLLQQYTDFPR